MPRVTFFLKQNPITKSALVILQCKWNGRKLTYSTKMRLEESEKKFWDNKTQRIKDVPETIRSGLYVSVKNSLDNFVNRVNKCYWDESGRDTVDVPEVENVKKLLDVMCGRTGQASERVVKDTLYTLLKKFKNKEVIRKGKELMKTGQYRTLLSHIEEYDKKRGERSSTRSPLRGGMTTSLF